VAANAAFAVLPGAVHDDVSAQLLRAGQFVGVPRRDHGARAQRLRNLQASQRHATAYAHDEHRLPGLDLRLCHQHAPRGQVVDAHGRALGKRPARGQRQDIARRCAHVLGKGPITLLAQHLVADAQHVIAAQAEFAATAGDARVQQHALARLQQRLSCGNSWRMAAPELRM